MAVKEVEFNLELRLRCDFIVGTESLPSCGAASLLRVLLREVSGKWWYL